ncbi:DEAD/DEAH box helicase [Aliamphritea spongicola]|uniref:DEAD/DEAH box helicase n=1 Tax=Aliamphritea spongicola TaxID=707589 RepID=UPI00196A2EAD|nr:DEAD/DEAH box helicase family protein [Aliamphritea spongicola]MBN3563307.1 DEAD/DEAH box helicase family protein [Aliamphritea spongicola]
MKLTFDAGSLLLSGDTSLLTEHSVDHLVFDSRVDAWRAPAWAYRSVIQQLKMRDCALEDQVFSTPPLQVPEQLSITLRDYQQEAVDSWQANQCQGLIILPTGVGKSIVAIEAIRRCGEAALIVLPTIDLMIQWATQLEKHFQQPIGVYGGGSKELHPITVITYDSAVLMMEYIGDRFPLIIFDECHHLPGPVNRQAAELSPAPYRLGLTATPERNDNGEHLLYSLIGHEVYRREINDFDDGVLALYDTEVIEVPMTAEEQTEYQLNRQQYLDFVRSHRISFSSPYGWSNFLRACAQAPDGRQVLQAFRTQKEIAAASAAKFDKLWELLNQHRGERIIIFTALNKLAYDIGERFLLPVITHNTKAAERKRFLDRFRQGEFTVLVTSKVLNEGIDVPEASVGIIVSGSGSVREHVQRLGRILRPSADKRARLYELISAGSSEMNISERRRQHLAYDNQTQDNPEQEN